MKDYYLNYSFADYKCIDKEDKIKDFIADFCYNSEILDKRINKLFSMNKWLYNYYEKEDIKQEVILALLNKSLKKFPYVVGEERVKYFNTVVSSVLCNLLKDNFDKNGTLILTDTMIIDETQLDREDNSLNEIFDLFIGEQLERQLLELYYEGYGDKEIMEILDIGRKKFRKIRNNIRCKLRERGYRNEN